MAALRFELGQYGGGMNTVMASGYRTTGEHTTSGTASNVEDASGDITAKPGDIFSAVCDGAVWVDFGGRTAAVGTGFYFPADERRDIHVTETGAVSVIDDI